MPVFGKTASERTTPKRGGGNYGDKKFEAIPAGTYDAEIVDVTFQKVNKEITPWKKWDDEFKFHFKLTGGDYKNRHFWAEAEAEISDWDKCRLRLWLQEILGVNELPESFTISDDPADLVQYSGLPCRIRISQYESQKYNEIRNSVDDVIGPRPSQLNTQAVSAEETF